MTDKLRYAGYPIAHVMKEPHRDSDQLRELLWGDTMKVLSDDPRSTYLQVSCRGATGYVLRSQTQAQRLLDVIFLDVGQGDSAVMITPRGERVLIDFGETDNTFRYLRWRYRDLKKVPFAAAILSHGDQDHYGGLATFCRRRDPAEEKFRFATLFHNGLIAEARPASDGAHRYYTNLETDRAQFDRAGRAGKGNQLRTSLERALACGRIGDLRSLSADDGVLPGIEATRDFRVEVLGPLLEPDGQGRPRLRSFGDFGKTKNGHSVVLKITYGAVRIMLGGDLNSPAEDLLLAHYGDRREGDAAIEVARGRLEVDVAKAFHHGAGADADARFLRAMNPVATVISSGDDESYSHPRADALGTIGRWSRGTRPLIFCTELARTGGDLTRHPQVRKKLAGKAPTAGRARRERQLDSSIARYGAINLRTDGRRMVLAQRVEKGPREWDAYVLEQDRSGGWQMKTDANPPRG